MNSKETDFVRTTRERAQLVSSVSYSRTWSVIIVKTTDRTDTEECMNSDKNGSQVEED